MQLAQDAGLLRWLEWAGITADFWSWVDPLDHWARLPGRRHVLVTVGPVVAAVFGEVVSECAALGRGRWCPRQACVFHAPMLRAGLMPTAI